MMAPRRSRAPVYSPVDRRMYDTQRLQRQQRQKRCRRIGCVILLLLLLAGIGVGIYFLVRHLQHSSSDTDASSSPATGGNPNPNQPVNNNNNGTLRSSSSSTGVASFGSSSSSSSTGEDNTEELDASILEFAARYRSDTDPETGMLLPELKQFAGTPCALRDNGLSDCVMDIVVVYGEASSDYKSLNANGPFDKRLQTYHLNANAEIVPYDVTSNLFGAFGYADTITPLISQYLSQDTKQFQNVLVIQALTTNFTQTDLALWAPQGYFYERLRQAIANALALTKPGSEIVMSLVHAPTRQAGTGAQRSLAFNFAQALRRDLLSNDSALLLTSLQPSVDFASAMYLSAPLWSLNASSSSDINLLDRIQEATLNVPLDSPLAFDYDVQLKNDLVGTSPLGDFAVIFQDTEQNTLDATQEGAFAPDAALFGRFTALTLNNTVDRMVRFSGLPQYSFEQPAEFESLYQPTGSSSGWNVMASTYSISFWVKSARDNPVQAGHLVQTLGLPSFRIELLDEYSVSLTHENERYDDDDQLVRSAPPSANFSSLDSGVPLFNTQAWTHLAWTYNDNTQALNMYVNGTFAMNQIMSTRNSNYNGALLLGGSSVAATSQGGSTTRQSANLQALSRLRVYKLPMSPDQVKQDFNSQGYQLETSFNITT